MAKIPHIKMSQPRIRKSAPAPKAGLPHAKKTQIPKTYIRTRKMSHAQKTAFGPAPVSDNAAAFPPVAGAPGPQAAFGPLPDAGAGGPIGGIQ